jgi:16S rRNA (cytidine1402-2'-O)-methyltransferase
MATGTLYVVSTPIGNLKDITYRAVETLKESDYIIAEDTRVTMKLLNHYGITSKLISYHKFNEKEREHEIISLLKDGVKISLVSDAGTPLLSDPGFNIVRACVDSGIRVETIPGASSILSAVVLSGFDPGRFVFYGFLERTEKAKSEELEKIKRSGYITVVFESPNRIRETLLEINRVMPGAEVAVVKEITKIHEQVYRGKAAEVAAAIPEDALRGEFVVVMAQYAEKDAAISREDVEKTLLELIGDGMSMSGAVKEAAKIFNLPKNDIYKISTKLKKEE